MRSPKERYPVVIVGGGPVGLYLAIVLRQQGIECAVLEKRTEPITHSRSLGIHPVSLELMEEVGLIDRFLEKGTKIREGIAFKGAKELGTLSFDSCPGPYRFVLSLPQFKTEELLEQHLKEIDPNSLLRGTELVEINQGSDSVSLTILRNGVKYNTRCTFLVGCDGKESTVRKSAGFNFEGGPYSDTYIMGDFSDNTVFGSRAAIFLCREGLIESFPLAENHRRWVVKTDKFIDEAERRDLEKRVAERIGHDLGEEENSMMSSFGVQKYVSKPLAQGRIFLAGDAAHIVSPIGGQGMNLGWLDARELSESLAKGLSGSENPDTLAEKYNRRRTHAVRQVIRRAELNMSLGRKTRFPFIRNALVWLMLKPPLNQLMARIFTMRGLNRWLV